MTGSLLARGLVEMAELIADRSVSPVELVESCLERIDLLDGQIKAFVNVFSDEAMTDAITAEREIAAGRYLGPLHGIPIAVKDIVNMAGVPTRAGSVVLVDATPESVDASVVARLKAAGAIILGKTTTHEFAFSV